MTQIGQHDDTAWVHSALNRYESELTRYAQRITGDAERARDVVQETFLRLCREEPAELDGHLAEWLFAVCRNKAIDVRRKESRMTTLADPELAEPARAEPVPMIQAEQRETAETVREIIERLPENERTVIRLKFEDGLSYRDIAEKTGLSISNVGFLIHRGLKTIRKKLKADH